MTTQVNVLTETAKKWWGYCTDEHFSCSLELVSTCLVLFPESTIELNDMLHKMQNWKEFTDCKNHLFDAVYDKDTTAFMQEYELEDLSVNSFNDLMKTQCEKHEERISFVFSSGGNGDCIDPYADDYSSEIEDWLAFCSLAESVFGMEYVD